MKARQWAALSAAVLMGIGFTAGCGEQPGSSQVSSNGSSQSTEGLSKTEKLKAELDFDGETLTFVCTPGWDYANPDSTDPEVIRRRERIAELEKKYNVKIVQKEGKGNYFDLMASTILSGEPMGHVLMVPDNQLLDWYKANVMANLNDAMEKTGIDFTDETLYSGETRRATNFDGKQVGFGPRAIQLGTAWFFNKRIFEEQNLGDPYEMVKNKTWTWDTVEEILTKATIRRADGTVEQWGMNSWTGFSFFSSMAGANGGSLVTFDNEGVPHQNLSDPRTVEALEKMYDWAFVKKIADINDGTRQWDAAMKEFAKGNVAICLGTNKMLQIAQETPMEDEFGVIYAPLGPGKTDYTVSETRGDMYFIPTTYESMADKLLLLMDDLFITSDGATQEDRIMEKYASQVRDKRAMEVFLASALSTNPGGGASFGMLHLEWMEPSIETICATIIRGEASPGDLVEQNRNQMEKMIEDQMDGHKATGMIRTSQ